MPLIHKYLLFYIVGEAFRLPLHGKPFPCKLEIKDFS